MDDTPCQAVLDNINRVMVGKRDAAELLMVALLANGHVLIEDVPGLGKTLLAKALAKSIGGTFKRIQFTPDLLPSDITGFNVFNQKSGEFIFQPGPVMSNVLLADEINRTIPRTQSSLLESMEEHQVTVDGKTMPLPRPFLVVATQNPIEMDGTFPLPEAQMDRFLIRVSLGYPDKKEELTILDRFRENDPLAALAPVTQPEELIELQQARCKIRVSVAVREYIIDLAVATRSHRALRFGVSPRGSLGLLRAGQALALLRQRDYVLPDDIKYLVQPVLAHRLIFKEEERLRGGNPAEIVAEILQKVPVPGTAERD
ncbi:MAG: MoxR family ATPase [Desulfobacterales bacterium]|nr:MoxR family ATPase [Desulfobacterales bacterium]